MRLMIGPMKASGVNLLQNDFASGIPSPLAFLGLADALGVECGQPRWSTRVLPVIHDLHVCLGRLKPEMQIKGKTANTSRYVPVEIPETMTGQVIFSLVVDLDDDVDTFKVHEFIGFANFAGSPVFPVRDRIPVREIGEEGDDLFGLRRGFALTPSGLGQGREPVSFGQKDTLEAISDRLFPAERIKGQGWLVPVAVGYRFLEDPKTVEPRTGTRNPDIPHVFAEPAVSVGELVSVRNARLTQLDEEDLNSAFWSWSVSSTGAFAHPSYTR